MKFICNLLLLLSIASFAQEGRLFLIVENNRIGYVNQKGEVKIPPAYYEGSDFSDGLAAVRQNGTYGYIDQSGKFKIAPQYDYAMDFANGYSMAFKDGKPFIIAKNGDVVLPPCYKSIYFINKQKAVVTTNSGVSGVIDMAAKKLVIDTLYVSIGKFEHGVAVVKHKKKNPTEDDNELDLGVIDSTGRYVVPLGKYSDIKSFTQGYAVVQIPAKVQGDNELEGVIDTTGKLLFTLPSPDGMYLSDNFSDGLGIINYYSPGSSRSREAYIDLKGYVVYKKVEKYLKPFSDQRVFIETDDDSYILYDTKFKRVGTNTYNSVQDNGFIDGHAVVEEDSGWGVIDKTGAFVVKPQYEEIVAVIDGYFFFSAVDEAEKLYGFGNLKGQIGKTMMMDFDRSGFHDGLIRALVDKKLTYLDSSGQIVWQEKKVADTLIQPLNIDYMARGYFYAYSTMQRDGSDSEGWAASRNMPKKLEGNELGDKGSLTVYINNKEKAPFAESYAGCKLYIKNPTRDTITFSAQDSRLYMKLQAKDLKGSWKDIEYLPSSWCGNSYHQVKLDPQSYWEFTIPEYQGEQKTVVRAELTYVSKSDPKKEEVVYSNEVEASINPGQFWNKKEYRPNGIMDPYND
jgi:hypothetical protein